MLTDFWGGSCHTCGVVARRAATARWSSSPASTCRCCSTTCTTATRIGVVELAERLQHEGSGQHPRPARRRPHELGPAPRRRPADPRPGGGGVGPAPDPAPHLGGGRRRPPRATGSATCSRRRRPASTCGWSSVAEAAAGARRPRRPPAGGAFLLVRDLATALALVEAGAAIPRSTSAAPLRAGQGQGQRVRLPRRRRPRHARALLARGVGSRCRTCRPRVPALDARSRTAVMTAGAPREAARHAPVTLVLIVHDHQPVGNFDGVFAGLHDAYDRSWLPRTHPACARAAHQRAAAQWIALHHRHVARLRALVERGQVELWGGGCYEPVLPAIPELDRRGQIRAMADCARSASSGQRPRGLWLDRAGVGAGRWPRAWRTPGSSTRRSTTPTSWRPGSSETSCGAAYRTEDQGRALGGVSDPSRAALPDSVRRRPSRRWSCCAAVAERGAGRIAVLGDDGEKFGVWPGTHAALLRARAGSSASRRRSADEPWIELQHAGRGDRASTPCARAGLPADRVLPRDAGVGAAARRAGAATARAREGARPGALGDAAHDLLRGGALAQLPGALPRVATGCTSACCARLDGCGVATRGDPVDARARPPVAGAVQLRLLARRVRRALPAAPARGGLPRADRWPSAMVAAERPRCSRAATSTSTVSTDALLETPAWAAWISTRGRRAVGVRRSPARCANYGDTLARRHEYYTTKLHAAACRRAVRATAIHAGDPCQGGRTGAAAGASATTRTSGDSLPGPAWRTTGGARTTGRGERFDARGAAPTAFASASVARVPKRPALEKRYRVGARTARSR